MVQAPGPRSSSPTPTPCPGASECCEQWTVHPPQHEGRLVTEAVLLLVPTPSNLPSSSLPTSHFSPFLSLVVSSGPGSFPLYPAYGYLSGPCEKGSLRLYRPNFLSGSIPSLSRWMTQICECRQECGFELPQRMKLTGVRSAVVPRGMVTEE